MMRARRTRGFTLVELLIAVAIVGILASLSVGLYADSVRMAREAEAPGIVMGLVTAQVNHESVFDTYVELTEQPRALSDVDKEVVDWPAPGSEEQIASWAPPAAARGAYYCMVSPASHVPLVCGGVVDGDGDGTGTAYATAVVNPGSTLVSATPQPTLLDWLIPSAQAAGVSGAVSFVFDHVEVGNATSSWVTSEVLARIGGSAGTVTPRGSGYGRDSSSDDSSGGSSGGGAGGSSDDPGTASDGDDASGGSTAGDDGSSSGSDGSGSTDDGADEDDEDDEECGGSHGLGHAYGHCKDRAQGRAVGHSR